MTNEKDKNNVVWDLKLSKTWAGVKIKEWKWWYRINSNLHRNYWLEIELVTKMKLKGIERLKKQSSKNHLWRTIKRQSFIEMLKNAKTISVIMVQYYKHNWGHKI